MQRGEIWWADLLPPRGSEPGYRRPVLIVQADTFTKSEIRTVLVIILTSNLRLANAPGNVALSRKSTGLPRESGAKVFHDFQGRALRFCFGGMLVQQGEVGRHAPLRIDVGHVHRVR